MSLILLKKVRFQSLNNVYKNFLASSSCYKFSFSSRMKKKGPYFPCLMPKLLLHDRKEEIRCIRLPIL